LRIAKNPKSPLQSKFTILIIAKYLYEYFHYLFMQLRTKSDSKCFRRWYP
jgi:hypothetical protein